MTSSESSEGLGVKLRLAVIHGGQAMMDKGMVNKYKFTNRCIDVHGEQK